MILVILDIILQEMNGFQLFREIKRIDKKAKVCFLSAGQLCYGTYSDIFSTIDAKLFYSETDRKSEFSNKKLKR